MKLKTLLLVGGVLAVSSANAAVTVTEVTEPKAQAPLLDGSEQYLYNVGTKMYFVGANDWGTRASVGATGYKVRFVDNGDGTYRFKNYVESKKGEYDAWATEATTIYVDYNNQGDAARTWLINQLENNRLTFANPTVGADLLLGADAGEDTRLYLKAVETEGFSSEWASVSPEEYAKFAGYQALYPQLVAADEIGMDIAKYEAVYSADTTTAEGLKIYAAILEQEIAAKKVSDLASTATVDSPADFTFKIANPDFASNSGTGWSGTGLGFQSYANAEHYNKTYNTYQQITDLPAGVYAVTAQAYYRAGNTATSFENYQAGKEKRAMLYGVNVKAESNDTIETPLVNNFEGIKPNNSLGGNETTATDAEGNVYYVPNNMATAKTYFDAGYYNGNNTLFAVTEGTAIIGVRKTSSISSDWSIFNKFGLVYYGNGAEAYQKFNENVMSKYTAYDVDAIQATISVVEAYNNEIAERSTASTYEEVLANEAAIKAQQALVEENIAAWAAYMDEVAAASIITSNSDKYSGEDAAILGEYIDFTSQDYLNAKEATTEEVIAETAKLAELKTNAIQNSIAIGADMTELIKNPDFSQGETGWTFQAVSGGAVVANKAAKCAEAWNNANFDIYQELGGAPAGAYTIEVQGFYRRGRGDNAWNLYFNADGTKKETVPETPAYVYCNEAKTPLANVFEYGVPSTENYFTSDYYKGPEIDGVALYYPNGMADAGLAFDRGNYLVKTYGLVAEKGDILRIGMKGNTTQEGDSWAIFTRFKLTYEGDNAEILAPALTDAIETLDFTDRTLGSEVKAKAAELKANGEAALASGNGKDMRLALNAILVYGDIISASESLFTTLTNEIADFQIFLLDAPEEYAELKSEAVLYVEGLKLDAMTNDDANAAIAKMAEYRYQLSIPVGIESASDENPVDMTAYIQTPSFEKDGVNSIDGWQNASGYNFGNDATQKGAMALEYYEKDFDMYQDIKVPADGTYYVTVNAFNRYKSATEDYNQFVQGIASLAELYAVCGDVEVVKPLEHVASDYNAQLEVGFGMGSETTYTNNDGLVYAIPNDMVSSNAHFLNGSYLNGVVIKVTGGTLRIGVRAKTHETGSWVIMDNFKLWYCGTNSAKENGSFNPVESVEEVAAKAQKVEFYTISGVKASKAQKGINIRVTTDAEGNVKATKEVK